MDKKPPTDPQAELTQRLDRYLTTEKEKQAFSGSVLVAQNGQSGGKTDRLILRQNGLEMTARKV